MGLLAMELSLNLKHNTFYNEISLTNLIHSVSVTKLNMTHVTILLVLMCYITRIC
jgi:hypothetical protein